MIQGRGAGAVAKHAGEFLGTFGFVGEFSNIHSRCVGGLIFGD